MPFYLAFDGGGSKCCAILYNETGPLGYGRAGGTNTNFTSLEDCRSNIASCLDQVLAGYEPPVIEAVHAVLVGPKDALTEALFARAEIGRLTILEEGRAGLLAGAMRRSGVVALSGTGSDAFYVSADGDHEMVGGLGAILGDQGSGSLIGQKALRAALAYQEGWGRKTLLLPLLHEEWGLTDKWELVHAVYGSEASFRKVASFVPVAAKAARLGDPVALSLFEEAGGVMAVQTLALLRRVKIPKDAYTCVCCGGAWKAHPAMYAAFVKRMGEGAPDMRVQKPVFEHVMAGVVANALERFPSLDATEIEQMLSVPYRRFCIEW